MGKVWTWVSVLGVVALLVVALMIKVPEPPAPAPTAAPQSVGLVDPVVISSTMLRDPTPLFLPTEFNSSRKDYIPKEPGGAFGGFQPEYVFDPQQLVLNLPLPTAIPASPAESLAGDPPGAPFIGFDRADPVVEPLSPRAAYVEVVDAGTGRSVFGTAVTDAHPPQTSVAWQPMEFMAAVDPAGLVGPVISTSRSGVDEVDAYFSRYLAETLRVGQRLAPGFYRISVGP
jgi:hypothetical protein